MISTAESRLKDAIDIVPEVDSLCNVGQFVQKQRKNSTVRKIENRNPGYAGRW